MPRSTADEKPEDYSPIIVGEGSMHQEVVFPKVTMKLLRNYRPASAFEIVGYLKPEVKKKTATGDWKIVEPEQFVPGEAAPPMFPGVGFETKIWAGTTIKIDQDEAKTMKRLGIAERDFED